MNVLIECIGKVLILTGSLLLLVIFAWLLVRFAGKLINEWNEARINMKSKRIVDDIFARLRKLESDMHDLKWEHLENHKSRGADK